MKKLEFLMVAIEKTTEQEFKTKIKNEKTIKFGNKKIEIIISDDEVSISNMPNKPRDETLAIMLKMTIENFLELSEGKSFEEAENFANEMVVIFAEENATLI